MHARFSVSLFFLLTFSLLFGQGLFGQAPLNTIARQITLAEAEEMLLQRNLNVVATRQQLEVSQALRTIAGYKPNPTLQLGAEQFPLYSPVAGSFPRFFATNGDAGANPTWTAQFGKLYERGGKRELRVAQAEAQIDAVKAQVSDVFRTQLLQLRTAFNTAMLARENLRLAKQMDGDYQKTEDLTTTRVKAGDLAAMEVFRVKAGRLVYKQAILDAETAYELAGRDIMSLLNAQGVVGGASQIAIPGGPMLEVAGGFLNRPIAQSVGELREIAVKERPDILVARNNLRAAQSGVELAKAQRARDVTVTMEYQRVGSDSALGLIAQMPLFLYNNQKAAVGQVLAQSRIAETQVRQAEMQALTDVEKAYQANRAARAAMELYSGDNLVQVEQLRKTVEFSYRRGEASLFELLDAQRIARAAEAGFNQAQANLQLSLWQMEAAVGRALDKP